MGEHGPACACGNRSPTTSARAASSADTNLPAVRADDDDLRRYLPGVEPDRQLNDWGRSERIEGLMDRTLVDFYYRYWFRAEVEGVENVPSAGGALLVSNHSGALPPDATMIGKAIKEEHAAPAAPQRHRRALLQGLPGLQHAAAEDRLRRRPPGERPPPALRRGAARAGLPRGPQGHGEALQGPLQAAPLRPRRLRRGRDARPRADRPGLRRRRRGGPADLRPADRRSRRSRGCCTRRSPRRSRTSARWRCWRTCRPSSGSASSTRSTSTRTASYDDKSLVQTVAQDIRTKIQENLWDMVGERKSVWFG